MLKKHLSVCWYFIYLFIYLSIFIYLFIIVHLHLSFFPILNIIICTWCYPDFLESNSSLQGVCKLGQRESLIPPLFLSSMFLWGTLGDIGCSAFSGQHNMLALAFYCYLCMFLCLLPLKKLLFSLFYCCLSSCLHFLEQCLLVSFCQSNYCPVVMTEKVHVEFSVPFPPSHSVVY